MGVAATHSRFSSRGSEGLELLRKVRNVSRVGSHLIPCGFRDRTPF